jgi:hypothetical protein
MLPFITAQVLLALFAHFIGNRNVELIWERRKYAPHDSPHDDPFHTFGALAALVVVVLGALFQNSLPASLISPFLLGFIYWLVFDTTIGKGAYGNPYYLGTTSEWDKRLLALFGKNAGRNKVRILAGVIVVLNLLYFLL